MAEAPPNSVPDRLDWHLKAHPHLAERIYRQVLVALHKGGVTSIDAIHDEARESAGRPRLQEGGDPNQLERDRLSDTERQHVETIIRRLTGAHFSGEEIDDLVNLTIKQEEVHNLETVANQANVSFRQLADKIQRFSELPLGETKLAPAEVMGTRVALIRHFFSDQLEFIGIAKNHLQIRDFADVTRHIIGSDAGMGRIGGKAGGMILAYKILADADEKAGGSPFLPVAMPESYFLRSDVVEDFLRLNRLHEYANQKYKPIDDVGREYPLIRGVFRIGDFPLEIVQRLRSILTAVGNHPVIVRSSSLLEDRLGTAFSGKYASVFVANQGSLEERLRTVLAAIAEVYASVMAPDPILYRREHNLIDYVEEMAVLIQKVVGVHVGDYFFPPFAGVAFSRNEYRWSPRIKREDGLARVVMGLGTRAVDRVGSDYPRMVALGAPTLRPESSVQEILRSGQQTMDVINIKRNRLESIRVQEAFEQGDGIPMIDRIVSVYRDGDLFSPPGLHIDARPDQLRVTFDKLIRTTPFAARVRDMLARLEDAYGMPIDMEFACDGEKFYMLQCRTLAQTRDAGPVRVPDNIPVEDVLFEATRFVRTGLIESIRYIVYVDPRVYDAVPSRERRVEIARAIGHLNHLLPKREFILVGPGRWGSNDICLGVPVRYADINHTRMLIEVARAKEGFVPEVSFGTHFFQDLVEADIHYLPLYPDTDGVRFNEAFLEQAGNALPRLAPKFADFEREIRVIDVPESARGRCLTIALDGEGERALAYLK